MRSVAPWASPSWSPSPPAASRRPAERLRPSCSRMASGTPSWSPASSLAPPASSRCSCCPPRRPSFPSCASLRGSLSTRTTMTSSTNRTTRRADAERSIARILDAAVDALGEDPEASMSAIAHRAGVVRATVYVHFPTREALLGAVTERAFGEVAAVIASAEPARGEPADALARVVAATWRTLGRYHPLVAINTGEHSHEELHQSHGAVLGTLVPLIER